MESKIKVYVKLDENKVITQINSSIFLKDTADWVEIDSGNGDKFSHAQGNYLEKGLMDGNGKFNYKFDNGLIELTDEEKETFFPTPTPEPTQLDIIEAQVTYTAVMTDTLLESEVA